MNSYRLKALEGLLDYLSGVQGGDLKSMMDEPENPMEPPPSMEGSPLEESMESPKDEMLEDGNPKALGEGDPGMADPKEIMAQGKPSDDEIEQLYKKFRR